MPEPTSPTLPESGQRNGAWHRGLFAHCLSFTAGALLLLAQPALPTLSAVFGVSVPALLPWRFRALYAAAALGALLSLIQVQTRLLERWPEARTGEDVAVEGAIVSLPDVDRVVARDKAAVGIGASLEPEAATNSSTVADISKNWHFLFAPAHFDAAGPLPSRIRTAWYRSDAMLKGGDCWRFTLRLRAPHGSANPGGFDYEGWLFRQGIGATATVRDATPCGIAPGHRILRLRQTLSDRFAGWLPGHPAEPLVAALTIGDDGGIASADWDVFRRTGTTHLIAISGFNIAIVAGVAFVLLRGLWALFPPLCLRVPAQRAALLGAALLGFAYAQLAGFEPPVARAAFMLLVLAAAALLGGRTQPSRALALAWVVIVASDPPSLLVPGLWLSFGAVAAIFYVSAARVGRIPAWRQALWLQLMLSLMLAPLTLFYFQGTSALGPLVNLVAVPIVAVLTPALLAALFAAWLWPAVGVSLLHGIADLLDALRRALSALAAQVPNAWLPASPEAPALLLALLGVVLLFAPRGLPLRPLAALCLLPLLFPPSRAPQSGFQLTALDVGQGLAVVIRTAHHAMLFDSGPAFDDGFDAGRSVVAPYLLQQGIRSLDLMMISHGDLDHRGGAPAVRQLVEVHEERGALRGTACAPGQGWVWDGVRFEVLNGPRAAAADLAAADAAAARQRTHADNNEGCVLRVSIGSHAALLPADIENATETSLVDDRSEQLRADVLLAPHHGSKTSSTPAFIAAVAPRLVIFPAGYHNPFRHPRAEVVARYAAIGAQMAMTGHAGAVSLRVDADGLHELREWRRDAPRLWSAPLLPVPADNR